MAFSANTTHRRGFLRALAQLPLIGGGISILGAPTAAATPITVPLLEKYHAFLSRESLATLAEMYLLKYPGAPAQERWSLADVESYRYDVPCCLLRESAEIEKLIASCPPSSRAAAVLSAAGALI